MRYSSQTVAFGPIPNLSYSMYFSHSRSLSTVYQLIPVPGYQFCSNSENNVSWVQSRTWARFAEFMKNELLSDQNIAFTRPDIASRHRTKHRLPNAPLVQADKQAAAPSVAQRTSGPQEMLGNDGAEQHRRGKALGPSTSSRSCWKLRRRKQTWSITSVQVCNRSRNDSKEVDSSDSTPKQAFDYNCGWIRTRL